ncbi:MAG: hypothetical protein MUP45_00025 [Candidatus Marinimicrobia bacterium]|nr:hypothetical protein [Candidatus Neomarinimicrobiota bacterium]
MAEKGKCLDCGKNRYLTSEGYCIECVRRRLNREDNHTANNQTAKPSSNT